MPEEQGHTYGTMESVKFDYRRGEYYKYMDYLKQNPPPLEDFMHDYTAYIGHMALNRTLTIYELYKKTLGIAGHIADVGVYKGASSLLFAKLIKIFEPEALTLCHGFDWFEGTKKSANDPDLVIDGGYKTSYEEVSKLVEMQGFSNILKIHKMNLITDCPAFFNKYKHLKFKLIMMDAGLYEVMKAAIPYFWQRLVPGGIMIFDQYSHEFAPGETMAINEILPDAVVRTLPNSWMPNAYIVKS
ncbi:MAG: class I SAM-dependent methyltransferase [Alphaproteobacteria bacterium]|nr:class I SAM-dependent methyltransferase [Alphaproteobacteria bacterium]